MGFKVLVVDDEPANVELLLEVFDMMDDCVVSHAYSPVDAIKMYQEEEFSLVLLDITMPEMSGFDVLERFSQFEKNSPPKIYVLTGHHSVEIKEKVLSLGAAGILTKPFEISSVVELVNELKE